MTSKNVPPPATGTSPGLSLQPVCLPRTSKAICSNLTYYLLLPNSSFSYFIISFENMIIHKGKQVRKIEIIPGSSFTLHIQTSTNSCWFLLYIFYLIYFLILTIFIQVLTCCLSYQDMLVNLCLWNLFNRVIFEKPTYIRVPPLLQILEAPPLELPMEMFPLIWPASANPSSLISPTPWLTIVLF